jgi:uncharacterized protein with ParB-like and HNH nuclease domain
MSNNTTALSLKTLLSDSKYIIPVYQRNYAWGKAEISQLIRDIKEFFSTNPGKSYYIGSLVCFKRESGDFELIDGQQRHTTISLINAVLRNRKFKEDRKEEEDAKVEDEQKKIEDTVSSSNLKFDSRKNVQRFLEELYAASDFEKFIETSTISGTQNFIDAIGFIAEEFNEKDFDVTDFASNFYNRVKFFRVEVPQDTDLNHYFEIMNNRGEQLEKHEIVKALLMGKIKNDNKEIEKQEQEVFAAIWNACSDMTDYVYFNFTKNRTDIFDENGDLKVSNFDHFPKEENETNDNNNEQSLLSILEKNELESAFPREESQIKEKYKSVLDFSNFLLQVLKLEYEDVSLDDKSLLKAFEKEIDAKKFIFDLLKYRVVFDKYIIKQDLSDSDEEKQNWSIRTLNTNFDGVKRNGVKRTYEENDEELIKLQTMLYYSNPSTTNNNWVQEILKQNYFGENPVEYAGNVFDKIAKSRFDNENLKYPNITAYNLYFIDFLLWKLYKEEVQGNSETFTEGTLKDKVSKNRDLFNTFKFKSLSSKEHLFPQSKANDFNINNDDLNGIGNLCLISSSQNSSGNKDLPEAKKKSFSNDNSSLKRLIMFESFENDKWETKQIQYHEKEINELIRQDT